MIKTNEAILDITDTKGNIRNALNEYAAYSECSQDSYFTLDAFDIIEYAENEDEKEDIKEGWFELLSEMKKANVFSITVLYWW